MTSKNQAASAWLALHRQGGASLIMVMIVLTIVSLLGITGIQVSMMSERGARNDRDQQLAWQSAEAALIDAEIDISGPGASTRRAIFTSKDASSFVDGCGTTGNTRGLCNIVSSGRPTWLTAGFDFSDTSSSAPSAAYGEFTGRTFESGTVGVQPAQPPRYVIEMLVDPGRVDLSKTGSEFVYRVTAIGFGPRTDIQAVLQMIYRD